MNLPSFILLALILIATALTIRKTIRSKGACEDCNSQTCPIKTAAPLTQAPKNDTHDCCK